ncbi:MAG: hypothetical protein OXC08_12090 [Thiotrichales bacterium]|nr:hypothetical protein [Thiotrichales bacterium]
MADLIKVGDRMMRVQRMADLTHAERTVLTVLAWHDGPRGAFPGVETLCVECGGVSPTWIRDLLRSLTEKGRIRRQRRRYQPSVFVIDYAISEQREFQRSGIRPEQRESRRQNNGNPVPIKGSEQSARGNGMDSDVIGWCRECGHGHDGGQNCLVCGTGERPFFVLPGECVDGTLTLPFGMRVSGLDSVEARRVFLSPAGQDALREAYATIFSGRANVARPQ